MENNDYLKLAISPPLDVAEKIYRYFDLDPACFQRCAALLSTIAGQ
ncbi:hypothetical protein SG34_002515 [Thalassomonas viridans]|uniref:Uncharacterized protein n=1 Tax=Thalassomonas viridans TaxID=137584 RepID=A0AAE9Z3X1_9GAMM|nr:hypothetical protein [Thalassomonas viridans]WDE05827.1 hypothetical protein SG34_002515 [Thalassomonas viridans]